MTRTPWGDSEGLAAKKLAPNNPLAPDQVAAHQRHRLMAATVATVAEQGYLATSVADVLSVARVSRSAFYTHFASKEACFLATVDAILTGGAAAASSAYAPAGPWDNRLIAAFEAFVNVAVQQPAAARIATVDVYAAGPAALRLTEAADEMFHRLVTQSFSQSPERADLPTETIHGIVSGIRKVIYTRLREGRSDELTALVPDLAAWALSYRSPPGGYQHGELVGSDPTPGLAGPPLTIPGFEASGATGNIHLAVADIVAEQGYAAFTVDELTRHPGVGLRALYKSYEGKDDAFLDAYREAIAQASRASAAAYGAAPDWASGLRDAITTLVGFLEAEPRWAVMCIVEVLGAGPEAIAQRDHSVALFTELLHPGFEVAPHVPSIAAEAIGGALYGTVYRHLRHHGAAGLTSTVPGAVFIALAPFIGSADAARLAFRSPATVRQG